MIVGLVHTSMISGNLFNCPCIEVNFWFVLLYFCSIGYPVVTMSFLIKHQITHIIRQVSWPHCRLSLHVVCACM